jgi:2-polyprenyl-3-methyl-5-hydroxy-6-metoxy-1,4-benzoquinol methylase
MGELLSVHIGSQSGFYEELGKGKGMTPRQLSLKAGTDERYTKEWLEQQAVAGILDVEDVSKPIRKYILPEGHREVLTDRDSLNYMAPLAQISASFAKVLPKIIKSYQTGKGIPYRDYGRDGVEGQAFGNRPMFINLLGKEWLPRIPEVHEILSSTPPARVADVACGAGFSTIAIAEAYTKARVDGFDPDGASISLARKTAQKSAARERVRFFQKSGADISHKYDVITIFEAIHDMAQPVELLKNVHRMLKKNGTVIIADERVQESFTAPGDELERYFYVASIMFCLPQSRAESPSVATGTAIRPKTMRRYAREAGFSKIKILPIENMLWRFYQLTP